MAIVGGWAGVAWLIAGAGLVVGWVWAAARSTRVGGRAPRLLCRVAISGWSHWRRSCECPAAVMAVLCESEGPGREPGALLLAPRVARQTAYYCCSSRGQQSAILPRHDAESQGLRTAIEFVELVDKRSRTDLERGFGCSRRSSLPPRDANSLSVSKITIQA